MARLNRAKLSPEALKGCKPLRNPEVEAQQEGDALVLSGRPAKVGLLGTLVSKASGAPMVKRYELEEVGAFVWSQLDGVRTFENVSKALQKQYKMNRLEADASLAAFLQMLSDRGLVTLLVKR